MHNNIVFLLFPLLLLGYTFFLSLVVYLRLLLFQELRDINVILKKFFLIFPNYCLGRGMMDLAGNQIQADAYARFGK